MDIKVEQQIEEISSSAIEFRKAIDRIIFRRLQDFFKKKGNEISRVSKLKDLLGGQFTPADWYELEDIGLRMPSLKRPKAFLTMTVGYVLVAIVAWTAVLWTNLEFVIASWSFPLGLIGGPVFMLTTFGPVIGFSALFKKRLLPVDNVDNFIDGVIAENWSDLLTDDKKLFRQILEQDLTCGQRASA